MPPVPHLNRSTALQYLRDYLASNHLDSQCTVKFCTGLPSAGIFVNRPKATLARVRCDDAYFDGDDDCKHSLLVSDRLLSSPQATVTATRILTFAVHEIGTHLVRRSNEEIQPWLHKRNRFGMTQHQREIKATEEGLAMVHEAMHLPSLLLARPALYYYASARASILSFADLFDELEQWVQCPQHRFDVCALVKRGIANTAEAGGNGEVQVYFEGAVRILRCAKTIDPVLLFCGKLTLDDMQLPRVLRVVRRDGVLLPEFARDVKAYRKALRQVARANGITASNWNDCDDVDPSQSIPDVVEMVPKTTAAAAVAAAAVLFPASRPAPAASPTSRRAPRRVMTPPICRSADRKHDAKGPKKTKKARSVGNAEDCGNADKKTKKSVRKRQKTADSFRKVCEPVSSQALSRSRMAPGRNRNSARTFVPLPSIHQHPLEAREQAAMQSPASATATLPSPSSANANPTPSTTTVTSSSASSSQWDTGSRKGTRPRYRVLRRERLPRGHVMMRDAPCSSRGRIIGSLMPGTIVVAYEQRSTWIRISPKQEWMATEWTSPSVGLEKLMEKVTG